MSNDSGSAYWPDSSDPLAQVHGREKFKALELKYMVLECSLIRDSGLLVEADLFNEHLLEAYGEKFELAKREAEADIAIAINQAKIVASKRQRDMEIQMKFRKKPVVIDAFQMTRARRLDNSEWPEWLHKAWNKPSDEAGAVFPKDYPESNGEDELCIFTLEGVHLVQFGDWIILGVKGELYPCKPDIFEMTYDPV